jgi:hypothetical protein
MTILKQELTLMIKRTILDLRFAIQSMDRGKFIFDALSIIGVLSGVVFLSDGYKSGDRVITILSGLILAICLLMMNARKM